MYLIIVIWLQYTIVVTYGNIQKLQGCMGQMSILVYPLHWGKHPRRRCEPPIYYAMLFFLPVSVKHPMKKPVGVGLNTPPLPIFLCQIPSSTSESMRTCFTEGGVCDMQGIWVNLGQYR